jgi:hypothetical protein
VRGLPAATRADERREPVGKVMAKRRSSYRLGRRLKASRKDRLDYIVYLQTGGDPTGGRVPDPRVRLKATMGLGGAVRAKAVVMQYLAGAFAAGGALRMNIFPPVTIRPSYEGGGTVTGAVRILQNLKATITGAGGMAARIAPAVMLGAVFNAGGEAKADIVYVSPDDDVNAIIGAMTVRPTWERSRLIDATVASLKDADAWDRLDVLYLMAAHDAQAGRINWKDPTSFTLTPIASPVFTPDVGFSSAGAGSCLSTGYTMTNDAINISGTNAEIMYRPMSDTIAGYYCGVSVVGVGVFTVSSRYGTSGTTLRAFIMNGGVAADIDVADRQQVFSAYRDGNSCVNYAHKTNQKGTNTAVSVQVPNVPISILAVNNGTSYVSPLTPGAPIGMFSIGALMDDDMHRTAFSAIIENYLANL